MGEKPLPFLLQCKQLVLVSILFIVKTCQIHQWWLFEGVPILKDFIAWPVCISPRVAKIAREGRMEHSSEKSCPKHCRWKSSYRCSHFSCWWSSVLSSSCARWNNLQGRQSRGMWTHSTASITRERHRAKIPGQASQKRAMIIWEIRKSDICVPK